MNDDNVARCIKCNAPLQMEEREPIPNGTHREAAENFQAARTVVEPVSGHRNSDVGTEIHGSGMHRRRPEPGPESSHDDGSRFASAPSGRPYAGGTINPWAQKKQVTCKLKNVDSGEIVDAKGDSFSLTRDNTNPADSTISSHQAILSHDANGWFIEDTSTYHTTAILVSRRTRLQEGDVVLMGSTRFVFSEEE